MKNQKKNLEKRRSLHFKMGLIIAFSVVLASFEWASFDINDKKVHFIDYGETMNLDEDVKNYKIKRTVAKQKPKSLTLIKIVVEPVPDPDPDPIIKIDPTITEIGIVDTPGDEGGEEPLPVTIYASAVEIAPYYLECKDVLNRENQANCSYGKIKAFVQSHAEYPQICIDANISGTVLVEFVVSETGKISSVEAVRKVHPLLDKEAIEAVKRLPQLIPASQQGKAVPVIYHIPVVFAIK